MSVRRVVPNFHADEPAAGRAFYEDVLGLQLAMDMGWIATFVSPTNSSAQVSLIRQDVSAKVHPDASVEVDDIEAIHEKAIERGFQVVYPLTDEPWGVRRFFVRDPNGVVINVMSHT